MPCRTIKKKNVVNLILFISLLLATLTLVPWYGVRVGFSGADWILFSALFFLTAGSITVGYHRLFAHRSFEAHPIVVFFSLFFGAAALEQSGLMWASQHRDHHRYVDTDYDPYNIKRGFWYAHISWILLWHQETDYSNVKDLSANRMIMHQHNHYLLWALSAGVFFPLLIGVLTGHLLGALLLGVIARLTVVHHSTFSINSFCHMFGRATYDVDATAKDHWLIALLTNGEGYHNFHHKFSSDYRNGIRWYHWDPSKWVIATLSWFGLTKKLYRTAPWRILAAKTAAEKVLVERELGRKNRHNLGPILEAIRARYEQTRDLLFEWENCERDWRRIREASSQKSAETIAAVGAQLKEKRGAFLRARREWLRFIKSRPIIPATAHF